MRNEIAKISGGIVAWYITVQICVPVVANHAMTQPLNTIS